jgi:hypothetical protein
MGENRIQTGTFHPAAIRSGWNGFCGGYQDKQHIQTRNKNKKSKFSTLLTNEYRAMLFSKESTSLAVKTLKVK